MIQNINLKDFPKKSGTYLFKANNEVIYVGSSKNLYFRMLNHKMCIKKGANNGCKEDFYQFLQSNQFTVEFQLETNYKQLEQQLIEQHNPKYNTFRANTGIAWNGNKAEYNKEYKQKFKEEIKQYYQEHKEEIKQHNKQYKNQLCNYKGETLKLNTLSERFRRKGVTNPTLEAKKYLIY